MFIFMLIFELIPSIFFRLLCYFLYDCFLEVISYYCFIVFWLPVNSSSNCTYSSGGGGGGGTVGASGCSSCQQDSFSRPHRCLVALRTSCSPASPSPTRRRSPCRSYRAAGIVWEHAWGCRRCPEPSSCSWAWTSRSRSKLSGGGKKTQEEIQPGVAIKPRREADQLTTRFLDEVVMIVIRS